MMNRSPSGNRHIWSWSRGHALGEHPSEVTELHLWVEEVICLRHLEVGPNWTSGV